MRRALALVACAVSSLIVLAFLVPLVLLIGEVARERAVSEAEQQAAALAPVLAAGPDRASVERAVARTRAGEQGRLALHLPDGALIGPSRAPAGALRAARARNRTERVAVRGGTAVVEPLVLGGRNPGGEDAALAEVFVPREQQRGALRAWLVLGGVGCLLVGGSVLLTDRLAARVVRPARRLAEASAALGAGDLTARVHPSGPAELREAGHAFNTMATRVDQLLTQERELAADLSHRLRTPLTALRLNAGELGDDAAAEQTRQAIDQLEREVDAVISGARRAEPGEDCDCDAAAVLRARLEFWSALAEDQRRSWCLRGADAEVRVPVPWAELGAAVDSVVGNVFRHTPQGTEFVVSLQRNDGVVGVVVEDAGPGVPEQDEALRRGRSSAGSTGLGLDIARRVAESTGGRIVLDRSSLGGARVCLWLWQRPAAPKRRSRRRWGRGWHRVRADSERSSHRP
ncbi:HAMP domain-containing sensor histidine kinase [Salinifilum aidingensis]